MNCTPICEQIYFEIMNKSQQLHRHFVCHYKIIIYDCYKTFKAFNMYMWAINNFTIHNFFYIIQESLLINANHEF